MEKPGTQFFLHGGWLDQRGFVEVRRPLFERESRRGGGSRCLPGGGSCFSFQSRRYAVLEHGVLYLYSDDAPGSRLRERVKLVGTELEVDMNEGIVNILAPKRDRHATARPLALCFDNKLVCQEWFEALMVSSEYVFSKHYEVGAVLGTGAYAQVRLCKDRLSKTSFAVKIVKFSRGSRTLPLELQNELAIMRKVHHENITELKDLFVDMDGGQACLIMEHARGGSLKDYVECDLPEPAVKEIVRQILRGVVYLHRMKICHRDIKLTNVLLDLAPNEESDGKGHCDGKLKLPRDLVKLIDFGLSKHGLIMASCVGSPRFIAPEVIAGRPYSFSADLWSVGVIAYALLSGGAYPICGENKEELFSRLASREIEPMDGERWLLVSDMAKQFVQKLLDFDPEERMSAEEALEHEWLK